MNVTHEIRPEDIHPENMPNERYIRICKLANSRRKTSARMDDDGDVKFAIFENDLKTFSKLIRNNSITRDLMVEAGRCARVAGPVTHHDVIITVSEDNIKKYPDGRVVERISLRVMYSELDKIINSTWGETMIFCGITLGAIGIVFGISYLALRAITALT